MATTIYMKQYFDQVNPHASSHLSKSEQASAMRRQNPYDCRDSYLVQPSDFRFAEFYDQDATGFEVPRHHWYRVYKEWLSIQREYDPGFRRASRMPPKPRQEYEIGGAPIKFEINERNVGKNICWSEEKRHHHVNDEIASSKAGSADSDDYCPKMFTRSMGQMIAKARSAAGLSQKDLAMKINVTANMIRDIELGGIVPFNGADPMVKNLTSSLGLKRLRYHE